MGSSHGVNCTGSEQSIAECTKNMEAADGSCGGFASYVRCHNASSCLDTEEESTTTTQPTPSDGTNAKHATTTDSSDPNGSTTLADPNSSTTLADTEPTKHHTAAALRGQPTGVPQMQVEKDSRAASRGASIATNGGMPSDYQVR